LRRFSCEQVAAVGELITVKILDIDESSGRIAGSIRQKFPNPWGTDALEVGQSYSATVLRFVECADRCNNGPAYLLEIIPVALVMLCTTETESDIVPGGMCNVRNIASNPSARAVTISHVNPT